MGVDLNMTLEQIQRKASFYNEFDIFLTSFRSLYFLVEEENCVHITR